MTIAPSSTVPQKKSPDPVVPDSPATLPQVTITGKADPHAETRAILKEIIERAPELIAGMTPDEVETYRQSIHDQLIGGGSAKTLVEMAEMTKGGVELTQKELEDPSVDPEADVAEDMPVTYGQMPQFANMLKLLTCRAADQQLKKETEADLVTASQTANSPEGAQAARNVKENQDLRKRLDLACTP